MPETPRAISPSQVPRGDSRVLPSWAAMKHDLLPLGPMTRAEMVRMWIAHYWWPTRRWVPTVDKWWCYHVRRFPKPPPMALDHVAQHLGFVDGFPACTDGPRCYSHNLEGRHDGRLRP